MCLAFLLIVSVLAQTSSYTPLNPLSLSPQTIQPSYIWNTGAYGVDTSAVRGNSTLFGTTLLLNTVTTNQTATANYSLSFIDLKDIHGYAKEFTLYVPAQLIFASNSTPLNVSVGGQRFSFFATEPMNFSWYSKNPAYVPAQTSLVQLPPNLRSTAGDYEFLPFVFNSSTLAQNTSIVVSITAPAYGQLYISDLVFSAVADFHSYVPTVAAVMGVITVPAAFAVAIGVFYAFRRLSAGSFAGTLAAGFCLQVGLAPLFMHSDVSVMIRYSELYFNYHLVNLQSWTYGPLWYATIILPPAPLYSIGVAPSFAEWSLLIKLPAIIADLLTFVVLIRLLSPYLGEQKAYYAAAIGWLFNPLVIYYSALHGLEESCVSLFLVLVVYSLQKRGPWRTILAACAAALTLISSAFIFPPLLLSQRTSWGQRIALVIVPVAVYVFLFLVLYHSLDGLVPYLGRVAETGSNAGLPLGYSTLSSVSYLYILYQWFGLYISPLLGLALTVAILLGTSLYGKEPLATHSALVLYCCILAFFFTYEVFYIQHLVWIVPLLMATLLLNPRVPFKSALVFSAFFSCFALLENYVSFYSPATAAVLAYPLFSLLLVPLAVCIPERLFGGATLPRLTILVRLMAVGLLLFLGASVIDLGGGSILIAAASIVAAISFLFLASGPALSSANSHELEALQRVCQPFAVALPLYLLLAVGVAEPIEVRIGALLAALCGSWEIIQIAHGWLTSGRDQYRTPKQGGPVPTMGLRS